MSNVVSPQQLAALIGQGKSVDVIDVRTPLEFRERHLAVARNVPLNELDPVRLQASRGRSSEPLYVVCNSGSRGRQASEMLSKAGLTNVFNIDGGTIACVDAGLQVITGKKAISLERQVRIVAGALVLFGSILGYFVNPIFIGLSAFIGAGLVFAGVTDTCGMGLALARMPWNQIASAKTPDVCTVPRQGAAN